MDARWFFPLFCCLLSGCSKNTLPNEQIVGKAYYRILGEDVYREIYVLRTADDGIRIKLYDDIIGWHPSHLVDSITADSIFFSPMASQADSSRNLEIVSHTKEKVTLRYGGMKFIWVPFMRNVSAADFARQDYDEAWINGYADRRDSILAAHTLLRTTMVR